MTGLELALIAFALMLLAIFLRVPIGVAMAGHGVCRHMGGSGSAHGPAWAVEIADL
jgi:hypothetical protein